MIAFCFNNSIDESESVPAGRLFRGPGPGPGGLRVKLVAEEEGMVGAGGYLPVVLQRPGLPDGEIDCIRGSIREPEGPEKGIPGSRAGRLAPRPRHINYRECAQYNAVNSRNDNRSDASYLYACNRNVDI